MIQNIIPGGFIRQQPGQHLFILFVFLGENRKDKIYIRGRKLDPTIWLNDVHNHIAHTGKTRI